MKANIKEGNLVIVVTKDDIFNDNVLSKEYEGQEVIVCTREWIDDLVERTIEQRIFSTKTEILTDIEFKRRCYEVACHTPNVTNFFQYADKVAKWLLPIDKLKE